MLNQLTLTRGLSFAAAVVLAVVTSGCGQPEAQAPSGVSLQPVKQAQPKLKREILPRDPLLNDKETLRTVMRDELGRLREVYITYENKSKGTIFRNEAGKPTEVRIELANGLTFEGTPAADLSVFTVARTYAAERKLLVAAVNNGDGSGEIQYFLPDGTTRQFQEETNTAGRLQTLYYTDGKTPLAQIQYPPTGTVRTALRLYGESGNLIYEEKGGEGDTTLRQYQGTVYSTAGQPTHRIMFSESIYLLGAGEPNTLEILAPDGQTSLRSHDLTQRVSIIDRANDAIGAFKSIDDLVAQKRASWLKIQELRLTVTKMETALLPLMRDSFN